MSEAIAKSSLNRIKHEPNLVYKLFVFFTVTFINFIFNERQEFESKCWKTNRFIEQLCSLKTTQKQLSFSLVYIIFISIYCQRAQIRYFVNCLVTSFGSGLSLSETGSDTRGKPFPDLTVKNYRISYCKNSILMLIKKQI